MNSLERFGRIVTATLVLGAFATFAARPAAQSSSAPWTVTGRALDAGGRPVAGAFVEARQQIVGQDPTTIPAYRGRTNAQGIYSISVRGAVAPLSVSGRAVVTFDGDEYELDLVPTNAAPFVGASGAVRDLRLAANNRFVSVVVQQAIGDAFDYGRVRVRLESVGRLIDGSTNKIVTSALRQTGDGWEVEGVPIGTYKVTATLDGEPLSVSPPLPPGSTFAGYRWAPSYTGKFERRGPGIYQLRVEVCSRANLWMKCVE